jgi:hypothetical protein
MASLARRARHLWIMALCSISTRLRREVTRQAKRHIAKDAQPKLVPLSGDLPTE